MQVRIGDVVKMRDGRIVKITDAVDNNTPESIQNPDNIFVGVEVDFGEGNSGTDPMTTKGTVVSNWDEVVSILF